MTRCSTRALCSLLVLCVPPALAAQSGPSSCDADTVTPPAGDATPATDMQRWHLMTFNATLAGNRASALSAARSVARSLDPDQLRRHPGLETDAPLVYFTLVNFGDWNGVFAEPLPPADLRFTSGMAYYARGVAFAARRRWAEARATRDTVRRIARQLPEGDQRTAMRIAALSLEGEIQLRSGRAREAVLAFEAAKVVEDSLACSAPLAWHYPVRHSLGRAQLAAGDPVAAERSYREDLARFPENIWSLTGLSLSLEREGRGAEADEVLVRLKTASNRADIHPTTSRY